MYDDSGNWIGGDSTLKGMSVDAPTYLYSAGFAELSGLAGIGGQSDNLDSFLAGSISLATITNHDTNDVFKASYVNYSTNGKGFGIGFGIDVGISEFYAKLPRHFSQEQVAESLQGPYIDNIKNYILGSTHNISGGDWKGYGIAFGLPSMKKSNGKNINFGKGGFFGSAQINGNTQWLKDLMPISQDQLKRQFYSAMTEGASGTTAGRGGCANVFNGMSAWEYSLWRNKQHAEWGYNKVFNK